MRAGQQAQCTARSSVGSGFYLPLGVSLPGSTFFRLAASRLILCPPIPPGLGNVLCLRAAPR